ncbi:hypothetical protein HAX54_011639 [Datura stramonium]|uniref:Late embryogenesis abundant protein LEA-2 subgroup domain-containing protein n=1 Tax=Datura stramonium TaxID=4076 RepID=A0ABS8TKD2_DATST|nr:hypothetical protein [Datura stramonium]
MTQLRSPKIWSSLSYRRERARKRHIFLQSYKLESYDSSRRTKLKKIVVKVNSVMVSVSSFMWPHTLRPDCNCQSSIHVVPPTRIIRAPPYHYGGEYYRNEKRKGGNFCVRCICCCYCVLFLIIIIFAGLAFYLYTYYDPKLPSYKFESLEIKEFGLQPNFTVSADVMVTLKAENPNEAIGLIYGEDSSINVTYEGSTICSGKFPAFEQGFKNTTILHIELKGKRQFGSTILESLQKNEKNGKIPFEVKVKVPVGVVFGKAVLKEFSVLADCPITVHDLKPGKKPEIESGKPTYKLLTN